MSSLEHHPHMDPHRYEKRNMSPVDSGIRALLGFLLLGGGLSALLAGWGPFILTVWLPLLASIILLRTGISAQCPIYSKLGVSTLEFEAQGPPHRHDEE